MFYKQTDYDYEFGTMSWEEYLVSYAQLEKLILNDWKAREGTPHYLMDKSYVSVYQFSELAAETTELEAVDKVISLLCNQ